MLVRGAGRALPPQITWDSLGFLVSSLCFSPQGPCLPMFPWLQAQGSVCWPLKIPPPTALDPALTLNTLQRRGAERSRP